jgi:NAD(P)-dependent dehydrogenase (short-subunit alcohol dehydrogenase family)
VIVTGSASGVGQATAVMAVAQGAKVAGFDRMDAPSEQLAGITHIKCDVGSSDSVAAAVKTVAEQYGHIDIVVNCAGVVSKVPLADQRMNDDTESPTWALVDVIGIHLC